MANLDTLRGYSQKSYGEVRQYAQTEYISQNQALGYQVLNEPLWNKGKLRRRLIILSARTFALPRPS
jgi:hypothetical protein